jgi:ribonuclease PH
VEYHRKNGRHSNDLRPLKITTDFQKHPLASVLIETGDTKLICAISESDTVPPFITEEGKGWVTAEYSLLPSSTYPRSQREAAKGKLSGRTSEIQRIIGRCLRSVVNLDMLGTRTLTIDCDTIQADGGTRTAAINGGFIALALGLAKLRESGRLSAGKLPITDYLAAVSVGITTDGVMLLDLDYTEDSTTAVDLNIVRTGSGKYVEIQGGAEKAPFTDAQLQEMLSMAGKGIDKIIEEEKRILSGIL